MNNKYTLVKIDQSKEAEYKAALSKDTYESEQFFKTTYIGYTFDGYFGKIESGGFILAAKDNGENFRSSRIESVSVDSGCNGEYLRIETNNSVYLIRGENVRDLLKDQNE